MKCYVDSSVILRILFDEPSPLMEWPKIKMGFSSRLIRLECLRTIDRLSIVYGWQPNQKAHYLEDLENLLSHIGILPVTHHVFKRAEQPFATPLGSLDSIHLASALLWKELHGDTFSFATHDAQLATAARAHALTAIGITT